MPTTFKPAKRIKAAYRTEVLLGGGVSIHGSLREFAQMTIDNYMPSNVVRQAAERWLANKAVA